ncbi:MAG: thiamin biosynthesis lipoprotein ApbE [Gammaproteobacteria bacterium]|nr:MAG: thiamin biosynthesis lipoprotein ApbE [Gammaproteobacteria bacterium]
MAERRAVLWLLAAAVWLAACDRPAPIVAFSGPTMGTTYSVKAVGPLPEGLDAAALQADLAGLLERLDQAMSTYRADSQVSAINRRDDDRPIALLPEVYAVLREAFEIHALTGGAFDITVGPLVDLWGFGPEQAGDRLPDPARIAALRAHVGMDKLRLIHEPPSLVKLDPAVRIDLSAIAKGYAVDALAERLEALGVENYLVEIGGELRVRGRNAEGRPWRIGIERPDPAGRRAGWLIEPGDAAVATSGNYRNFREVQGMRVAHIIDPRTGLPVRHDLVSVTVVAARCSRADALATALFVMGPEEGFALASRRNLAAFFVSAGEDGYRTRATAAFEALWVRSDPSSP